MLTLAVATLCSLVAAAGSTYRVVTNGTVTTESAIVVDGKTYVPLTVLARLGVKSQLDGGILNLTSASTVTPGGANARVSLEGCLGQTLFNGVWRLTVKAVRPITRYGTYPGYGLTLEWKNGTTRSIDALNTGVKSVTLVLADGTTLTSEDIQSLLYKKLPQAAGTSLELPFYADAPKAANQFARPTKLLVEIDAAQAAASNVAYTTPTPSFRVLLDCKK
ncbi:hypothetical protein [Deinococcus yavapaiensis]|nr:hypothetical protein [Deinococcus yavapaiensis]